MSFYNILLTTWKRERQDPDLVKLETDFFEKCRAYITHLGSVTESEPSELLTELFKSRFERSIYLVNDIISLRIEKHIRDALMQKQPPSDISMEEPQFRQELDAVIIKFRNIVLGIENEEDTIPLDDDHEYLLVRFLQNNSMVTLGADLRQYGPFQKHDICYMPTENVQNLLKKGIVERITLS